MIVSGGNEVNTRSTMPRPGSPPPRTQPSPAISLREPGRPARIQLTLNPPAAAATAATTPTTSPAPVHLHNISNNSNNLLLNHRNQSHTHRVATTPTPPPTIQTFSLVTTARTITPTPQTTTATATTTTTTTTTNEVTLQAPRPEGERLVNEYVETPLQKRPTLHTPNNKDEQKKKQLEAKAAHCPKHSQSHAQGKHQHQHQHQQQQYHRQTNANERSGPITKQPVSFTKEPGLGQLRSSAGVGLTGTSALSIMCERCGRCRCESCREPPPLPSRWICNDKFLCSAENLLDYCSCLCCVKGLFYHCSESAAGTADSRELSTDELCSCTAPKAPRRWACLGALSFLLPCLLCYWPLKACVGCCEACWAEHATQGCRCEPRYSPSSAASNSTSASGTGAVGATTQVPGRLLGSGQLQSSPSDPEKRLLDHQQGSEL